MKNKGLIRKLENEIEVLLNSQQEFGKNLASKYTQLFELYSSNTDLESIKRSLFLQWYAVSEPQYLTGLPDFEKNMQKNNLNKVEHALRSEKRDEELISMLGHYYEISDWYFNSISNIDKLIKTDHKLELTSNRQDRGLMGRYWASLTKQL